MHLHYPINIASEPIGRRLYIMRLGLVGSDQALKAQARRTALTAWAFALVKVGPIGPIAMAAQRTVL